MDGFYDWLERHTPVMPEYNHAKFLLGLGELAAANFLADALNKISGETVADDALRVGGAALSFTLIYKGAKTIWREIIKPIPEDMVQLDIE